MCASAYVDAWVNVRMHACVGMGVSCVLCLCLGQCVCICHSRDCKKIFLVSKDKNKVLKS